MAKELPYFKFIASEWLTGNIIYESLEVQGLFVNICALYWQRGGVLTVSEVEYRWKKKTLIAKLCDRFISQCDGMIKITFLDEQLYDRQYVSVKNAKNAKDGWEKRKAEEKCDSNANECNKEEEKNKKEKKKRKEEEQELPDGSYQKFLQIYSDWYQQKVGVKIIFDGAQGNALKKIITFLIANSKEKNCTGGAAAWEYILQNWSLLDQFYQDQVKVTQITSNLPNILNQLKNGNSKSKPKNDRNNIHSLIDEMFSQSPAE